MTETLVVLSLHLHHVRLNLLSVPWDSIAVFGTSTGLLGSASRGNFIMHMASLCLVSEMMNHKCTVDVWQRRTRKKVF